MAAETYLVVIETKVEGAVVAASEPKTIVADSVKAAEQKAIVQMSEKSEYKEGMEATAVPFRGLSRQ